MNPYFTFNVSPLSLSSGCSDCVVCIENVKATKTILVIHGIYVTLIYFSENPKQHSCVLLSDGYTWSVSVRTQAKQRSSPEKTTFVPAVGVLLQSRRRRWTQAQSSTPSLPPRTRIPRRTYSRLKSTQTLNLAPSCLLKCTMTRNPNYSLFHCTRIQGLFRPASRRRNWTRQPPGLVSFLPKWQKYLLRAKEVLSYFIAYAFKCIQGHR